MDTKPNSRKKRVFFWALIAASGVVIVFQNCAKSVDLGQYNGSSAVSANGTCNMPSALTWSVNGQTCMTTTTGLPGVSPNNQITLDANAPSIGSATFTCTSTGLVPASGATCDLSCAPPANYQWTVAGVTCTAPGGTSEISNGTSVTATASTAGTNTGSATFTCSSNNFGPATSATCTQAAVPGCTEPATLSWVVGGVTCTAPGGQAFANDQSVTVTATTPNKGSATFTCANQKLDPPTSTTCVVSVPKPVISSITPTAATGCVIDAFTFAVTATGTSLTYQWYSYTAAAPTPVAIAGATAALYSGDFRPGEVFYYVIVSNAGGSATSTTVAATGSASCGSRD